MTGPKMPQKLRRLIKQRRMSRRHLSAVLISFALCATYSGIAQTTPARQPSGIYARYVPGGCLNQDGNTNAQTDDCISNAVAPLLTNSAISGIEVIVQWSELCPSVPPNSATSTNGTTNWNVLDDVFATVAVWNAANSNSPPKTVQLGIIPGFDTPRWILNQLVSCNPMFTSNGINTNLVTNTCGCATFLSGEGPNSTYTPKLLPLPWNPIYTNAWANFIRAVGQRYATNPLLVTVEVAGPTSDSTEMILPNEKNNPTNYWKWNPLFSLTFPTNYQNSDQAFIEAWERAIDLYGQVFSNTTLAVTTGSGFPNFLYTNLPDAKGMPYATYTVSAGFAWPPGSVNTNDLAHVMDAAAETTILAYFADARHGGNNAKAVQEDGLAANEINLAPLGGRTLGSYGVKWLAETSASGNTILPGATNSLSRVLGGLQFVGGFSTDTVGEGCNEPGGCPTNYSISPEQAFYNVMEVFFDGTSVGGAYGTNDSYGTLPLNYLQIYSVDVLYANTNMTGTNIVDGFGNTVHMTAQSELTNVSAQIGTIAEPPIVPPVLIQPGWTDRHFSFTLQSEPGLPFAILASTNVAAPMTSWASIAIITNVTGTLLFTDPATNFNQRLYRAHQLGYPRRPLGVYAKVVLSEVVKSNTNADWNSYFDCLYGNLLANPAISGLALQVNWDLVNMASNVFNWRYVTNAFNQVSNWNTLNPQTPKTIQFIVTAGFNSPQWVLTDIESTNGSCDGMFNGLGCANCANCGTVTFVGYDENADGNVLPLPWNQIYKTAWSNFLFEINQQFGDNPALVSISVAGPTASSDEMILPNDMNTCPCHTDARNPCGDICPAGTNAQPQPNGLMPGQMWNELLAAHYGPSSTNSNQAFVEEWENAIGLYDGIFHNLTLVVTPANGEGFPFDPATPTTNPLCQYSMDGSCTAVAGILTYFENHRSVNGNGKASQVSGLKSNILTLENGDANIGGVKFLSAQWQTASPWDQILGGAQFNHAFSSCLPTNCAPNPEQDEFNILANFFNGTPAVTGTATFPGLFLKVPDENTVNPPLTNSAPLNYLQVYYQDVLYAESNGCAMIDIAGGGGKAEYISVSAQDLLNAANQLLLTIGEPPYPRGAIPAYPPVCSPSPPPACEPP